MTGNGSGMIYNIYFFLCCSFCSSQACIVTMPNVYFEEHELAHCPWCGSGMVRSTVEVLCMDCSIFFTERIHPSCVWKDQISSSMVSVCDKKDFGDSAYEHSDIGTNYSRATYTGERLVFADTSGSSTPSFQKEQQLVMYDKFTEALQTSRGPFFLEEDLWVEVVRSESLSQCWVTIAGGDGLVQLALPEFQFISRYFTSESPLGFVIINCTTKSTFHICNLGNVQSCGLRSACHYLRNYPRRTIGFILSYAENGCREIAFVQCSTLERNFRDRYRFHIAQGIIDRMLKLIICRYDYVVFRRGPMK